MAVGVNGDASLPNASRRVPVKICAAVGRFNIFLRKFVRMFAFPEACHCWLGQQWAPGTRFNTAGRGNSGTLRPLWLGGSLALPVGVTATAGAQGVRI